MSALPERSEPPEPEPIEESTRLSATGRVEAFSDGVMAIAITLLVLNLRTPTTDEVNRAHGLLPALLDEWPSYLAYLAAFLTVGIIWLNHHTFMDKVNRFDGVLHWWNLLLLLGVATLPFPTSVLAAYVTQGGDNARVAAAVYAGLAMLMATPWVFMLRHLRDHPELLEPPMTSAAAARELRRGSVGVVVYAGAIVVALIAPFISLLVFIGIAIFYAITSQGVSGRPSPRRNRPSS